MTGKIALPRLPDRPTSAAGALRALAGWFDEVDRMRGSLNEHDIQDDLRMWADRVDGERADTPALLRPDDPPWYREPTAEKPGQVANWDYPGDDWEWRRPAGPVWYRGAVDGTTYIVEARRIEPEPVPVTVPVPVEPRPPKPLFAPWETDCTDQEAMLWAGYALALSVWTDRRIAAYEALIAEARRS